MALQWYEMRDRPEEKKKLLGVWSDDDICEVLYLIMKMAQFMMVSDGGPKNFNNGVGKGIRIRSWEGEIER